MNPLIHIKTITLPILIPLVLGCVALLPRVQAAPDPAPPPGANTRDGAGAMAHITTGQFNTAFGTNALFSLTTGDNNAAQGNSALFTNTDGNGNTAVGSIALRFLTTGDHNVAIGNTALNNITTGSRNTAVGYGTLRSGNFNDNVAVGWSALISNTTGENLTAIGTRALESNTSASFNTAVGSGALESNSSGTSNTAVGYTALLSSTGNSNTAVGESALANTTGNNNIALGAIAGINLQAGNFNIYIESQGGTTESNTIRIGHIGGQTRAFISGIFGVTTATAATPVVVSTQGQLGTVSSSRRFKNEIKPMDKSSEAILALRPVTFHYNSDNTATPQFGLIAEEVAAVNPDLVVRDEKGDIYSVRYDAVNAMLLNEFLKEHRTVQELKATAAKQEATIAKQQKQIDALTAGLQKVSAQLEVSKTAPQVVGNNR
jgi:Chaperone of endosialidase